MNIYQVSSNAEGLLKKRASLLWLAEKTMAPHSSTLAWKIPWMEEPGRLQFMGSLRVGHDWATSLSLFTFMHQRRKWQPTPVFSPGDPGMGEPGGLPSMGSHRVGHDWSDLAAAAAVTCHLTGVCSFLTSITWTLGFNSDLWSCQLWNIPTLDRLRSYPWSFLICHTLLYWLLFWLLLIPSSFNVYMVS